MKKRYIYLRLFALKALCGNSGGRVPYENNRQIER